MDRAVKEVVSGIVQRSVSIATQTTKELVLKVCLLFLFSLTLQVEITSVSLNI